MVIQSPLPAGNCGEQIQPFIWGSHAHFGKSHCRNSPAYKSTAIAQGKYSFLHPAASVLLLRLGPCITQGFFTFLTEEELDADSLRFLCLKRKRSQDSDDYQDTTSPT